ncbi:T9SS type A sorting domain-containing protein [Chitinophagaceae bacterium LB-8]|uniref:T9SS type A sorting domain-containing protein n=1 Tax=Paraflavisolibacter caeni TaxID=2982496 RepID=A0A9X2Y2I0_9BACT|nr:T9SS type A sorting domain-containing protein [Paraflavisolibacter caeni]MCU7552603.1 T9SS type A sorting domain-containing protein [Paraflavisolibacter caeni]
MNKRLLLFILSSFAISTTSFLRAQTDRFAYAVTDMDNTGAQWNVIRKLDLQTGEYSPILFNGIADYTTVYDAVSKKLLLGDIKNNPRLAKPFYSGVAAVAFDKRHNRLYFTPMFIDQLRYIDLSTMKLYYVNDRPFTGLGDWQGDQGKIITRMVIAPDGNGYAITNDGKTFIRFTTGKKPVITKLGSLIDDPSNNGVSISNGISSFGGDMIACDDGSFYLVTARNQVFTIDPETKMAKYLGAISGLPAKFTANGMVVNEEGKLLVSSAVDSSGWFVVDPVSLKATPYKAAVSVFRSSDLANSNILSFRKKLESVPIITQQIRDAKLVQVYPNPVTSNIFTLAFTNLNAGVYTVQLVDISGRQVMQQKLNLGFRGQIQNFNLPSGRAKGMYFVKVLNQDKKSVFEKKIIVQ